MRGSQSLAAGLTFLLIACTSPSAAVPPGTGSAPSEPAASEPSGPSESAAGDTPGGATLSGSVTVISHWTNSAPNSTASGDGTVTLDVRLVPAGPGDPHLVDAGWTYHVSKTEKAHDRNDSAGCTTDSGGTIEGSGRVTAGGSISGLLRGEGLQIAVQLAAHSEGKLVTVCDIGSRLEVPQSSDTLETLGCTDSSDLIGAPAGTNRFDFSCHAPLLPGEGEVVVTGIVAAP